MSKKNLLLIISISVIALIARLIPHTANFSPMASIILFAAVYSQDKKYLLLPLLALFVSDIFLGFYKWEIMLTVYLAFASMYGIGHLVRRDKNPINVINGSLASALLFFLTTNFAVWYFGDWYAKDLSGLILSYTMAIPFFKSTLLSSLLYTGLMFGSYEYFRLLQNKSIQQKS